MKKRNKQRKSILDFDSGMEINKLFLVDTMLRALVLYVQMYVPWASDATNQGTFNVPLQRLLYRGRINGFAKIDKGGTGDKGN